MQVKTNIPLTSIYCYNIRLKLLFTYLALGGVAIFWSFCVQAQNKGLVTNQQDIVQFIKAQNERSALEAKMKRKKGRRGSTTNTSTKLPARLSYIDYAPIPKNQGTSAACISFAVAEGLGLVIARMKGINEPQLFEQIYSLAPVQTHKAMVYSKNPHLEDPCSEPLHLPQAMNFLKENGIKKCKDNSRACFECINEINPANYSSEHLFFLPIKLYDQKNDPLTPALLFHNLKQNLHQGYPIIIGCAIPIIFDQLKTDIYQPKPFQTATILGNHAMVIIGYDDAMFEGKGAFLVANSKGTEWGDGGFAWICYDDLANPQRFNLELAYAITLKEANKTNVNIKSDSKSSIFKYVDGILQFIPFSNSRGAKNDTILIDIAIEKSNVKDTIYAFDYNNFALLTPSEESDSLNTFYNIGWHKKEYKQDYIVLLQSQQPIDNIQSFLFNIEDEKTEKVRNANDVQIQVADWLRHQGWHVLTPDLEIFDEAAERTPTNQHNNTFSKLFSNNSVVLKVINIKP
ncbi:MAG: C1 family peptidase [Chitinophagales bacterium]